MRSAALNTTVEKSNAALSFADSYISLRRAEHRLYTDSEVKLLPETGKDHLYHDEWEKRAWSARRLISHLSRKKKRLQILEVGCGNGWLCHRLSKIPSSVVTGIDVNRLELDQAARVFSSLKNLHFMYGSFGSTSLTPQTFDAIIFAASLQYFESLQVLHHAIELLKPSGELHILDTAFYKEGELPSAKDRSQSYFKGMNAEGMEKFYFHHAISALRAFDHRLLYDPSSWRHKLLRRKHPFHWVLIKPRL